MAEDGRTKACIAREFMQERGRKQIGRRLWKSCET
jgi:hypothetical protein